MQQNLTNPTDSLAAGNNSGQGFSSTVPPEIQGWNWGAFALTWIWGIDNRVWLSLLALIPVLPVSLAMMVVLGIKGNEWAWQCKKWDSIEQFRKRQRTWMYWSIAGFIVAPILLFIGVALLIIGFYGLYRYGYFG